MPDMQNALTPDQAALAGAFVETAFTAEQVARALLDEARAGVREERCRFLVPVKPMVEPAA